MEQPSPKAHCFHQFGRFRKTTNAKLFIPKTMRLPKAISELYSKEEVSFLEQYGTVLGAISAKVIRVREVSSGELANKLARCYVVAQGKTEPIDEIERFWGNFWHNHSSLLADNHLSKFLQSKNVKRLPFEVLPPGSCPASEFLKRLKDSSKSKKVDPKRIKFVTRRLKELARLKPKTYYIGRELWRGYVVLTFSHTHKAVLECALENNATYILGRNWKHLASRTKQDLWQRRPTGYCRITHTPGWFGRVKDALRVPKR